MLKNLKDYLNAANVSFENVVLKERVEFLESEIRYAVTQQGDDLCWLDVYRRLAASVGIEFDPRLCEPREMRKNCDKFIDSIYSGEPYRMGDYVGKYGLEIVLHLACGHCDKTWQMSIQGLDDIKDKSYFCPYCGQQQNFEVALPI